MAFGGILNGLRLNEPYKVVLYIAGIIYILSFFFTPIGVEVSKLRGNCQIFIGMSVFLWILHEVINWDIKTKVIKWEDDNYSDAEIAEKLKPEMNFWHVALLVAYIVALFLAGY